MEHISELATITITVPDELAYEAIQTIPGRGMRVVKQRSKKRLGGTIRVIQVKFIPVYF